jgi:hypothetical protein
MPFHPHCVLVYAVAPDGTGAREANDALNEYIADGRRGLPVFHDHFVGRPHGGVAVFYLRDEAEAALLDDPGQLAAWELETHRLTFALTALGFRAQTEFTVEQYGGTSFQALAAQEPADPRYWWQKRD